MNKSESITNLAVAIVKFNGEISRIAKDANNPFFKNSYATLDHIVDEVRPILNKHGLAVMQIPGGDGENVIMKTLLIHESGEWMESEPLTMKPVKNDPQAVGSCITYARRYSLNAFLSLSTGEDDDGNKATHGNQAPKTNGNSGNGDQPPENVFEKPASEKQIGLVHKLLEDLEGLGSNYDAVITELKKQIGSFNKIEELTIPQASNAITVLKQWVDKKRNKGA
jgi:hypothetical protein